MWRRCVLCPKQALIQQNSSHPGKDIGERVQVAKLAQRALNLLSIGQLYLRSNINLKSPLSSTDVKRRPLGHWGACSGINFILAGLSVYTSLEAKTILPVIGTGHAGASWNAWLYLRNLFPHYDRDLSSAEHLCQNFGTKDGLPTEVLGSLPYTVFSGGEIGPALSVAYGASLEQPTSLVPCIIGDGELETGPALASLRFPFLLNPARSAMLLPIVNLNGYRMGSRSILSRLNKSDLELFFRGYGLVPFIVDGSFDAFFWALEQSNHLYEIAKSKEQSFNCRKNRLPLIIVRTEKGFGIPRVHGEKFLVGSHRTHKTPLSAPHQNSTERSCLESWLEKQTPKDIFDSSNELCHELKALFDNIPLVELASCQTSILIDPLLSQQGDFEKRASPARAIGQYLCKLVASHSGSKTKPLMIFSPDELLSNQCESLLDLKGLVGAKDDVNSSCAFSLDSQCVEILSEHFCQGALQGYTQVGGKGIFITYEAFAPVASSMAKQHIKFLAQQASTHSESFKLLSHQPSVAKYLHTPESRFLDTLLSGPTAGVEIYTPVDAASSVASLSEMLKSKTIVNALYCSKSDIPVLNVSIADIRKGYKEITIGESGAKDTVSVLVCGDYQVNEVLLAARAFTTIRPDKKVNIVLILRLSILYRSDSNFIKDSSLRDASRIFFSFLGSNYTARALSTYFPKELQVEKIFSFNNKHCAGSPDLILSANECGRVHIFKAFAETVGLTLSEVEIQRLHSQIEQPCKKVKLRDELQNANKILKGRKYN